MLHRPVQQVDVCSPTSTAHRRHLLRSGGGQRKVVLWKNTQSAALGSNGSNKFE